MDNLATDIAAKLAVNTITEVFKTCFHGFDKAKKWLQTKTKEYDPIGLAAKRYTDKLEERYGQMRIFGMTKPVPLRSIYTRVNILEKITARQRLTIGELEKYFDRDQRGFGSKRESKTGTEVVNELKKFIILGKPGAGKTTFLKYIALQAADGKLTKKQVPVFIGLKDFSDSPNSKSMLNFIVEQFDICDFPESKPFVERILKHGKCLLLLDGLDEVSKEQADSVIRQIRKFSDKYNANSFILSCRIAAYNYCFEKFTDVEMADYNDEQIQTFVNNWFGKKSKKAELCWAKLNENEPIKELACIPLLLTMLCLAFDETMDFPLNRGELYKEALDALLKKWDASKSIKRHEIYRHLSLKRKESMFSRIAATTFENDQYFFPQRTLEKHIADFIQHLPEAKEETLEPDSEAILKAIEAQHGIFIERAKGIYSFSHLTFQEYFTAKYIVDNATKGTLKKLIENHLIDDKWREVFLLTAGMLEEADEFFLLMKAKIDILVAAKKLTELLKVIQNDIVKKDAPYSPPACRALAIFYVLHFFTRDRDRDLLGLTRDRAFDDLPESTQCRYIELIELTRLFALDFLGLTCIRAHDLNLNVEFALDLDFARDLVRSLFRNRSLLKSFKVYLNTNRLLVDCLNTECYVSKQTRQKILDELLTVP